MLGCIQIKSDVATKTQCFPFIFRTPTVQLRQLSTLPLITFDKLVRHLKLSVALHCHNLQLPVTCLSNLTPRQQSKLHGSLSHNGSCFGNYVSPPATQSLHNTPSFCCRIGFGVNAPSGDQHLMVPTTKLFSHLFITIMCKAKSPEIHYISSYKLQKYFTPITL